VTLQVPTAGAFTAMKVAAYIEGRSPRDLHDLGGLTTEGMPPRAADLVRALLGRDVTAQEFEALAEAYGWT
jgi:hypothetical protein